MIMHGCVSVCSVCLLVMYLGCTYADLDKLCTSERRREGPVSGSVCGANLVQIVTDICFPYGINGANKKRSVISTAEDVGLKEIFLNKRDASTYLSKRTLYEKGITCECCYHRCRFRELQQYCRSPNIYAKRSTDS
ncbi:con-Ins Im2-like [Liolophura sinensis]|uniref:con-Ins Im2-like n=1 Tax=Liolophura sinensis TaxID=3198878 RepID=UPI0031588B89